MTALPLPTGRRGMAFALGLVVVALLLVWSGAVAPLCALYAQRSDTLQREALLLRRMQSLAQALPALSRLAEAQTAHSVTIPALQGGSDGVAAAALQQKLNDFATEAGLHIASAETLPPEPDGAWHGISLRLTTSGAWPDVTRLLLAIAQSDTPMVVDDLHLASPNAASDPTAPILASFTVTTWRGTGT
jgi:general secretion pathway protein M